MQDMRYFVMSACPTPYRAGSSNEATPDLLGATLTKFKAESDQDQLRAGP